MKSIAKIVEEISHQEWIKTLNKSIQRLKFYHLRE